ncbi:ankyrin repeat-containing domain protein [Trichoderma sp. SZMC 28015]
MEHGNGSNFAQLIFPEGTGHQHYYRGQGYQINNGSGTINNFHRTLPNLDDAREKLLRALYTTPYLQRKDRNPDRVPGTCQWFMNHHDFHHWRENTSSSMLWVSANPGCGKSVLAKYLVNELKTTEQRTTCYFFFKDDFEDQRSARGALSCMLHQLFIQRKNLLSAEIIHRFRSYKAPLANSYDLWELWDILTMVAQERDAGQIVCILDAFDECGNQERQDLAKVLREFYGPSGDIKKNINLKFLITSRPYEKIRRDVIRPFDVQDCPVIHLKGEGDAEVKEIAKEISLYIKDRVSLVGKNLDLTQAEADILLTGLEAVPNQTYLWVYLTLEWIETEIKNNDISEAEIRKAISTLPQTVDEAYDKILARSTSMEETKKLLHIVVAAERPLTLEEMGLALAIQQHHKCYESLNLRPRDGVGKYIRDLCGLFINITDDKIYLLHQTAKEFLVFTDTPQCKQYKLAQRSGVFRKKHRNGLTWKFSLIPLESHRILCKICIWRLLSYPEFETRPVFREADIHSILRRHLFFGYSAKNWIVHFRASNITENEILEQLKELCNATIDFYPTWVKVYWKDTYDRIPLEFTTLMIASYFGIESLVRLELERADAGIDFVLRSDERTALSFASENGFDNVVRLLIRGPKFYWKRALKKATHLSFTKGADVNAIDKYGRTALFYAVWNGHLPIVKRLVTERALVDMRDIIGGTPISYALCYGHEDIANELMRGAQPDSVDEIRRELFLSAVKHDHDPVIKRLLDNGADPGATDEEGVSLVVLAIKKRKRNIVKLLIERGADPNKGDRNGTIPLILAVKEGETDMVELMIERGADVNGSDCHGQTPLLFAIAHRNKNIIKLLVESGADINKQDYSGKTPLSFALNQRDTNTIQLLMERGSGVKKDTL